MKKFIFQFILFCGMISALNAQNKIKQYEYWLDNNIANKQIVDITPTDKVKLNTTLNISGLIQGLHYLNIRFIDTSDNYSSIISQPIEAFSANPKITAYEYWFDNDYTNKIKVELSPGKNISLNNLNLADFSEGLYSFNIRFLDTAFKWSAVQTTKIFKAKNSSIQNNAITGYRYWIDNDFAGNKFQGLNENSKNSNITESLDLTSFPAGSNHFLNIQFKDAYGLWSNIQRTHFRNSGGGTLLFNAVSGYRYWIEGNFATSVFREINPALASVSLNENIDLINFIGNDRKLYFQFKDAVGMWSAITTDTVHVNTHVGFERVFSDDGNINLFPNPSKGKFTISTKNTLADVNIIIVNSVGESVYIEHFESYSGNNIVLENIQTGIYFLRIVDNKNAKSIVTKKLIVKY